MYHIAGGQQVTACYFGLAHVATTGGAAFIAQTLAGGFVNFSIYAATAQ
jgi:hypothetical protein